MWDALGDWNQHIYTAIYKIEEQQEPTVWHRELYSIFYNNWKKYFICVSVKLNHCAVHLKLTTHCESTMFQLKKIITS